MAGLAAARRELMVDLDPALDSILPAALPERCVDRDYRSRVSPGNFPVTAQVVTDLHLDYDLTGASVRSLTVRPTETGLQAQLTLAAPRRFEPSTGRVAPDGSRRPWPAAPLSFSFDGVTDLEFDAEDRIGMTVTRADAGPSVTIGESGRLRAAYGSVWPNDPMWHESTAGRVAGAMTPPARPSLREPVFATRLAPQQQAAARALVRLMTRIRLVNYYPELAASVPVREICAVATDAGSAILAASARRGSDRRQAFAEFVERWQCDLPEVLPRPIPAGPAMLRHAAYHESHDDYDIHREGSALLLTASPDEDLAAPWRLASQKIVQPERFRISSTAFDGVRRLRSAAGVLAIDDSLVIG
jgi:hypothetical protein